MAVLYVLLGAIFIQIVGALWYSDFVFGKIWKKLSGVKMSKKSSQGMTKKLVLGFISNIVLALALYVLMANQIQGFGMAFILGFLLVVVFGAVVALSSYVWEERSMGLFWIHYVYMTITAGLLAGLYSLIQPAG